MRDAVDELLAPYDPSVRQIVQELRALVCRLVPEAREKVYGGWKNVGYSWDGRMKTSFCAIGPHSRHVNLYLHVGADLDDPDGLLEGAGKKMRHVKLHAADEVNADRLARLILQAASITRVST